MSRIMGVDYGLKRIGIAMTDILQVVASPFAVIESVSLKKDAAKIVDIAKKNDVSCIVFGLPINMNGTQGEMAQTVRKIIEEIKLISNVDVTTIDERLTTSQAERMLVCEANVSRHKRKGLKDKIAASFILQTYLDMKSNKTL
ncbi:MAG: Holliday junction resolvase RuvX [Endomicrobium sp.]|uniref:Holliday junction resolvase RuvX n=1 Tax=Candidatus Endomicrobiellum cubanum TaxID=3242325 RepID=UPI00282CB3FF|nr:Holliday junction resolvase RuvX [Endomicrobium sp.]